MTHLNNCCPVERIDAIRLGNGQRVVLRPALEQDLHLHGRTSTACRMSRATIVSSIRRLRPPQRC